MEKIYDCVYYWVGGTEQGVWKKAKPAHKAYLYELRRDIEKMGYTCVYGCTNIGSPENPPSK